MLLPPAYVCVYIHVFHCQLHVYSKVRRVFSSTDHWCTFFPRFNATNGIDSSPGRDNVMNSLGVDICCAAPVNLVHQN